MPVRVHALAAGFVQILFQHMQHSKPMSNECCPSRTPVLRFTILIEGAVTVVLMEKEGLYTKHTGLNLSCKKQVHKELSSEALSSTHSWGEFDRLYHHGRCTLTEHA